MNSDGFDLHIPNALPVMVAVRTRVQRASGMQRENAAAEAIADLVGSVDGLPVHLSAREKHSLRATGYWP